jgi:hypothetical protein
MKQNLLSPESRVLLLAVARQPDATAIRSAIEDPAFSWGRLIWLAQKEKATNSVSVALRSLSEDLCPKEPLTRLNQIVRVTEFRMVRLEQLLSGALDALAHANIDVVLLKGASLATSVYDGFTARPMYDLDLLVRPEQAQHAWNTLRASGWTHDEVSCPAEFYQSHFHLPPLDDAQGTGLALELHSSPTDGAVLLSGDVIWRDARAVDVHGRRAFIPSAEHQVLHLAVHFAWSHGLASAAWRTFRDLDQLIRRGRVDWNALTLAAARMGAGTCCYWTFRLAAALADVRVPDEAMERLRPPRPDWLLNLIERHYAANLFRFSPAPCPSVRMSHMLWSAGMAPRWSGHGALRPWHRGEAWAVSGEHAGSRPAAEARLPSRRAAEWQRYAAAILSSGRGSRRLHSV